MTTSAHFLTRLDQILVYKKGDHRAPHKPLYLLLCIAALQQGLPRLRKFDEVSQILGEALCRFGPRVATVHPEYPFWRLQHDGLAVVEADGPLDQRSSNDDPKVSSLRVQNARGGLTEPDHELLLGDLELQSIAVHKLLDAHFPASIHDEVLRFFNLVLSDPHSRDNYTERDFRESVLAAYRNTCALTGYSLRFGDAYVGLEAAHLCWPQVGGNDSVSNGVAMTTLHRKLFHLGMFGINESYEIHVSSQLQENTKKGLNLGELHGRKIQLPRDPANYPSQKNLKWHAKWVFRG